MTNVVPLVHQALDRLLDQVLALGVDLAGGLVEDQDRRLAEDRAGDAEALPLPAGELAADAVEQRVVALGLFQDEVVREGALGGGDDLVARRARLAVGDVLARSCRGR